MISAFLDTQELLKLFYMLQLMIQKCKLYEIKLKAPI